MPSTARTIPSQLFLECALKMSTLLSHTGCQTISPLVNSIVSDLLLEFAPGRLADAVNIHDTRCDAIMMS